MRNDTSYTYLMGYETQLTIDLSFLCSFSVVAFGFASMQLF